MDLKKLIGDASAAVPEDLLPVVHELASGELRSIVVIGEKQDGTIKTMWQLNMNEGCSNEFAVIGGLEVVKQEILFGLEDEDKE